MRDQEELAALAMIKLSSIRVSSLISAPPAPPPAPAKNPATRHSSSTVTGVQLRNNGRYAGGGRDVRRDMGKVMFSGTLSTVTPPPWPSQSPNLPTHTSPNLPTHTSPNLPFVPTTHSNPHPHPHAQVAINSHIHSHSDLHTHIHTHVNPEYGHSIAHAHTHACSLSPAPAPKWCGKRRGEREVGEKGGERRGGQRRGVGEGGEKDFKDGKARFCFVKHSQTSVVVSSSGSLL